MSDLRFNRIKAKISIILLFIVIGLEVVYFILNYQRNSLINDISIMDREISYIKTLDLNSISDKREVIEKLEESIRTNDALIFNFRVSRFVGIACGAIWGMSIFLFVEWFRNAYYNLGLKTKTDFDVRWALWSWIVPIVSFVIPYRMMNELYHKTISIFRKNNISVKKSLNPNILIWWWGSWIITNITMIVLIVIIKSNYVNDFLDAIIVRLISNIIGVIFASLTIKVIKGYSDNEPLLQQIQEKNNN